MQSNNNEEPTLAPMDLPTTSMPPGVKQYFNTRKGRKIAIYRHDPGICYVLFSVLYIFPARRLVIKSD